MVCEKAELKLAGDAILHGMDSLPLALHQRDKADTPFDHTGMKVEKLYKFVLSTVPGKKDVNPEKNRTLWSPIFHYAVDKLVHPDCHGGVGHKSSTKKFSKAYIENEEIMA